MSSRFFTPRSKRAFTLIELLVVITIIAILAGIALPVFQNSMAKSRETQCGSNMRQVGIGLSAYAADNNGQFPAASDADGVIWTKALGPYIPQRGSSATSTENIVFVCPEADYGFAMDDISRAYAATGSMLEGGSARKSRSSEDIYASSYAPLVVEGKQDGNNKYCKSNYKWSDVQGDLQAQEPEDTDKLAFRHRGRMNILYADMSVHGMSLAKAKTEITESRWNGVQK